MIQKQILTNNAQVWSNDQRYRVNAVVTFGGKIYQNTTGKNSSPDALTDWVLLSNNGVGITAYSQDFAYIGSNDFAVPNDLIITTVLFNKIDITSFTKTGTVLTISDTLVTDDVIAVRGFTY